MSGKKQIPRILYYSLDSILQRNAQYNIIFGERSNGKTYAVLKYGVENYIRTGKQIALVRRFIEDIRGKRGDVLFNALSANGEIEKMTKGRYTSLCVVGDLTFRTYRTGTPKNETRLQIYDRTTLIGDVQVPYGFKVMGYIEPYYYSEFICDEDKETIEIYRFKL